MKLLALSDVHNNLVAVRRMRSLEKNSFDAIVVAGDIGSECASDFFKILSTFKCPIVYVFGNWDRKIGYRCSFGPDCHLVHLNFVKVGSLTFTGLSGCPTNWGRNPIARRLRRPVEEAHKSIVDAYAEAKKRFLVELEVVGLEKARERLQKVTGSKAYQRYLEQSQQVAREIHDQNRQQFVTNIRKYGTDINRMIVVTHERMTRVKDNLPGLPLHLFGHIHRFSEHDYVGTKYVDVAALDRPISARPRLKSKWSDDDCRNFNAGNYTIIEINSSHEIAVKCVYLPHDYRNWVPLEGRRFNGIEWISEEKKWTNPSDPQLIKYEEFRTS